MKSTFLSLTTATAAAALSFHALAAPPDYPTQPVRLIVPFAPGGTTDIVARAISHRTGEALGKPLVVDNKSGGGGTLGAAEAARAKPDGYTLGLATVSTTATNPAINPKLPYNPLTDIIPIINIAATPNVLAVNPDFPGQNFQAFVSEVQRSPGKYPYGTAGTGSIGHLLMEILSSQAKLSLNHIPYRGSGPALIDAIGGQVPMVFDNLPSALPFIRSGKLVAIAVASPERVVQLPDVPTFRELGMNDVNRTAFYGISAPKGTPAAIVERVNKAVKQALASPEVQKQITDTGSRIVGGSPEEFAGEIAVENAAYRKIAAERNITAD